MSVPAYVRRGRIDGIAAASGLAVLVLASLVARTGTVSSLEAWVFHRVNDLPDALYRPMWVLQFAGLLLTPLVPMVVALALRRFRLAAGCASPRWPSGSVSSSPGCTWARTTRSTSSPAQQSV